jgi:hypothetical protein
LSAVWNPGQLIPDNNDATQQQFEHLTQTESATMSINGADSMSSDSGAPLDRFMQRRLQRLNTEQGFREQRQASLSQQSQAQHSKSSSLQQADSLHQQQQGHQHLQQQQQQPPQRQQSLPDYADQPLPTRIPAQVIPSGVAALSLPSRHPAATAIPTPAQFRKTARRRSNPAVDLEFDQSPAPSALNDLVQPELRCQRPRTLHPVATTTTTTQRCRSLDAAAPSRGLDRGPDSLVADRPPGAP